MSGIGIILKKTSTKYVIDIVRKLSENGNKKDNVEVNLYFSDFKCPVPNNLYEHDVIKFTYKKEINNDCYNITVLSIKKLNTKTIKGKLGFRTIKKNTLISLTDCNNVVYIAYNIDLDKIASSHLCKNVSIEYVELNDCDLRIDISSSTEIRKLVYLIKIYSLESKCDESIYDESKCDESKCDESKCDESIYDESKCDESKYYTKFELFIIMLRHLRLCLGIFAIFLLFNWLSCILLI
jgi:predicted nucleotidyltransferase